MIQTMGEAMQTGCPMYQGVPRFEGDTGLCLGVGTEGHRGCRGIMFYMNPTGKGDPRSDALNPSKHGIRDMDKLCYCGLVEKH